MSHKVVLAALLCSAVIVGASAQSSDNSNSTQSPGTTSTQSITGSQQDTQVEPMAQTPTYRVNVVARTTKAVNYRHRAGSTKVDIHGTDLMPAAIGQAKVDSKAGRLEINATLEKLRSAKMFGPEYLTYVLWAITPEGRAVNLGEVLPNDDGKVDTRVTTDLQAFGLIITAEPYFAVTRPSNMVVAENIVRGDTKGWEQPIDARFELLERGQYTVDLTPAQLPATSADPKKVPLELLEARNAVAIAKAQGAERYAPDALRKAEEFLAKGEDYLSRKQSRSAIGTVARGATQQAEDARVLTIRRREEERVAAERRRLQEQEQAARQQAETSAAVATQAQQQAATEAQGRAQAEQERLAAEQARMEAEQAAQRAAQERAAAEQARQEALQQQQQLQGQVEQARLTAQQAEQQREQLRARLLKQLNDVLQTKDSARGLIVQMSDVLFDTGKATLRPGARERLARVAGIILAYPDLRLQIEGHTDSVGSDSYNLTLSERRAATVRDYLISQGVNLNNVTARGFGKAEPVASNATPTGRQMNRRVELVVSGEAIASRGTGQVPATGAGGTSGGAVGAATGMTGTPGAGATGAGAMASPTTPPQSAQPSIQPQPGQPVQPAPSGTSTPPTSSTPQPVPR